MTLSNKINAGDCKSPLSIEIRVKRIVFFFKFILFNIYSLKKYFMPNVFNGGWLQYSRISYQGAIAMQEFRGKRFLKSNAVSSVEDLMSYSNILKYGIEQETKLFSHDNRKKVILWTSVVVSQRD